MKKSTKGAIAASAAGVLLLGGAGSLAYWSDSENITGGNIASGELDLSTPVCAPTWTGPTTIVPGDTLTKTCTFTITAKGENLAATLTTPLTINHTVTSTPAPTTLSLPVTVAYKVGGTALSPDITSANNGNVVTATLTVTLPYGDATAINANDTQKLTASLDTIAIKAVQKAPVA